MTTAPPPWRLAVRLPAVRAASLLLLLCPAFVAWGGSGEQASLRLRIVAAGLAVVLAQLWDDRCAPSIAATPVGLPAVRRGRSLVVLLLLAVAWGASSVAAARSVEVPVAALALEAAALSALLLALVGLLARGRDGEPVVAYSVPVLLVVAVVLSRLPARWSLIGAAPGDPGWAAERARWAAVLAAAVVVVAWCGRDPAARRRILRRGH